MNPPVLSKPAEIGTIVGALCGLVALLILGAYVARKIVRRRHTKLDIQPMTESGDEETRQEVEAPLRSQEVDNTIARLEMAGDNRRYRPGDDVNRQELGGPDFSHEMS